MQKQEIKHIQAFKLCLSIWTDLYEKKMMSVGFDLFFRTSGGYPLGPMLLASPGAPLVQFLDFGEKSRSESAPMSKNPEQHFDTF